MANKPINGANDQLFQQKEQERLRRQAALDAVRKSRGLPVEGLSKNAKSGNKYGSN